MRVHTLEGSWLLTGDLHCGSPDQPLGIFSAMANLWVSELLLYSDDNLTF